MKVFILHHEHEGPDHDDVKLIGIYASEPEAELAMARARMLPGFRDAPDGFSIDAYEVGHDHWTSGFSTVTWTEGATANEAAAISEDRAA